MKAQKIHVKVGDEVKIISGSYKNSIGEIKTINKKRFVVAIRHSYHFRFNRVTTNPFSI